METPAPVKTPLSETHQGDTALEHCPGHATGSAPAPRASPHPGSVANAVGSV